MTNVPNFSSELATFGHIGAMLDSFRTKTTKPNKTGVEK